MRRFKINRPIDINGISGTGFVIDGVIFDDGTIIIQWKTKYQSIAIFKSFEDFKAVHIDSHPENLTKIIFLDE